MEWYKYATNKYARLQDVECLVRFSVRLCALILVWVMLCWEIEPSVEREMLANGEWQEVMWDYVRDLVDLKRVDYLLTQRRSGIIEILFVERWILDHGVIGVC